MEQGALALDCDAHGVFFISHQGDDEGVLSVAKEFKRQNSNSFVGINLLSTSSMNALKRSLDIGMDGLWLDDVGITSVGRTPEGEAFAQALANCKDFKAFGGVAFKYQAFEPDPALAAKNMIEAGLIPTTSGSKTGEPPSVGKIEKMSWAAKGQLAIASGMSSQNIQDYVEYITHVFIASSVSLDQHHFDELALSRFVGTARGLLTTRF